MSHNCYHIYYFITLETKIIERKLKSLNAIIFLCNYGDRTYKITVEDYIAIRYEICSI